MCPKTESPTEQPLRETGRASLLREKGRERKEWMRERDRPVTGAEQREEVSPSMLKRPPRAKDKDIHNTATHQVPLTRGAEQR